MGRLIVIIAAVLTSLPAFAQQRDALPKEANRILRAMPDPVSHPNYRGIFLQLRRLKQLPDTDNAKLESLALLAPPAENGAAIAWPPHVSDLEAMLLTELGPTPQKKLSDAWLSRLNTLLRVENKMQRLPAERGYRKISELTVEMLMNPAKAAANGVQIALLRKELDEKRESFLREIAREDVDFLLHSTTPRGGKPADSFFADTKVRFPGGMAPTLLPLVPQGALKVDANGTVSLTMLQARDLLAKPLPAPVALDVSRIISENVRQRLPVGVQNRRALADIVDDLQFKQQKQTPPGTPPPAVGPNVFAGPVPGCTSKALPPGFSKFYALPPVTKDGQTSASNACFVDPINPVNRSSASIAATNQVEPLRNSSPDSFPIELVNHTGQTDSEGNEKLSVQGCMISIVDPAAAEGALPGSVNEFPPAPGRDRHRRVFALTASHCVQNKDALESVDISGFGKVPKENIDFRPMGGSDFTMMVMDVPEMTAVELATQKQRFVTPPSEAEENKVVEALNGGRIGVLADANIRDRNTGVRNAGNTFSVPGVANEIGLNFRHFGNQGIYPGDSGGGVVSVVNGKKMWLGAMSYKCLSSTFDDSVGAMASGPDVFKFVRENLKDGATKQIRSNADRQLARHQMHDDQPGDFRFNAVHGEVTF